MATARNPKLIRMVQLAILLALEAIMAFTPIGMIITPLFAVTLMHIPVIIGAILLGPLCGGVLGGVFGVLSLLRATLGGGPGDVLFNPVASGNPLGSLILAILPRIIIGVVAALLYRLTKRICHSDYAALPITAVVTTALHTVLVLGTMFLLFSHHPLMAGQEVKMVFTSVVALNGLIEMGSALVLVTAICRPLLLAFGRSPSPALSKSK